MKKEDGRRKTWLALLLALALVMAPGCGSSGGSKDTAASVATEEAAEDSVAEENFSMAMEAGTGTGGDSLGTEALEASGEKLIKTVDLSMETREFDTLLENIRAKTVEFGGYVEESQVSGNSYYNTRGYRYAWLTLRIPSDRLDEFVELAGELGNVVSKNESVRNVTLQYVDVESHIEALETEQTRLLELMEQAESMEDIITIESRLSEIRYELQSYESTLRTYDNQVDYSTVTVNVDEVERETVTEEDPGFFAEIRIKLSDNLYQIGQGFRSFGVWLISSLPYLALIGVSIWIAAALLRKLLWKKPVFGRKRKEKKEEKTTAGPEEK